MLHEMTDQEMVECARRTSPGSMYRTMAERIEQRSADCLALVNALTRLANGTDHYTAARAVLERLEESGTMAALKRTGGR